MFWYGNMVTLLLNDEENTLPLIVIGDQQFSDTSATINYSMYNAYN